MICTVTSSLIGQSFINRFCAPAWIKPPRKPMTPSPARACPEPVSYAESVTDHVPFRFGDFLLQLLKLRCSVLDTVNVHLEEKTRTEFYARRASILLGNNICR